MDLDLDEDNIEIISEITNNQESLVGTVLLYIKLSKYIK